MEMKELTLEKFEEASEIVEKVTQETQKPKPTRQNQNL